MQCCIACWISPNVMLAADSLKTLKILSLSGLPFRVLIFLIAATSLSPKNIHNKLIIIWILPVHNTYVFCLFAWEPNQTQFDRTYSNLTPFFFIKKILNYFNNFQNQTFSVLWLKWTEAVEMKLNQAFFHRTHSNLTSYLFLSKNAKVFQRLLKSKFISFMTNVNSNNEYEKKSYIFPLDKFKFDIIFHWSQNTNIFQRFLLASLNFIGKVSKNK